MANHVHKFHVHDYNVAVQLAKDEGENADERLYGWCVGQSHEIRKDESPQITVQIFAGDNILGSVNLDLTKERRGI